MRSIIRRRVINAQSINKVSDCGKTRTKTGRGLFIIPLFRIGAASVGRRGSYPVRPA